MYLECILMCILYVYIRFGGVAVGRRRFRPVLHATDGATWRWRTVLCGPDTHTTVHTHRELDHRDTHRCERMQRCNHPICVFTPAITITAHHHRGRTGHRPRSPHCGHARARPGLYEYVVTLFDFAPRSPRPGRTKRKNESRATATTARRDWISRDRFVSLEFGLTGLLPLWQDSLTSTH